MDPPTQEVEGEADMAWDEIQLRESATNLPHPAFRINVSLLSIRKVALELQQVSVFLADVPKLVLAKSHGLASKWRC